MSRRAILLGCIHMPTKKKRSARRVAGMHFVPIVLDGVVFLSQQVAHISSMSALQTSDAQAAIKPQCGTPSTMIATVIASPTKENRVPK